MKTQPKNSSEHLSTGIIVLLSTSFLFFVYAPFEMLFSNQDDLWFDMYMLLPTALLLFGIAMLVGSGIFSLLRIMNGGCYRIAVTICFSSLICLYIQGNFMSGNLPPLDGTDINWNDYMGDRLGSLLVWVGILAGLLFFYRKILWERLRKIISTVSLFLFLMLLSSLVITGILSKGYVKKTTLSATTKDEFELSEDSNFIILVLDALDAGTFSDMMEDDPQYKEIFQDFTFFNNVMGVYPFTKHSIPFILSGDWYENDEPFDDYVSNALRKSPILDRLEEEGYKLGLYEEGCLNLTADGSEKRFDNIVANGTQVSSRSKFAMAMVQLAGIKYAPFELKRFCYGSPETIRNLRQSKSDIKDPLFTWENTIFYKSIQNNDLTLTKDKCFKFIHIEGAHVPFRYDKDVNIVKEGTSYRSNVEASMTIAESYLKKLKEMGVYDNSVIIIMGDHGYDAEETSTLGRMNPILLIKGLNEKHQMQISDAPLSYVDLQDAFIELLSGAESENVFYWESGEYRERRALMYEYGEDEHMEEYVQTGNADDLTTLLPTGKEYDLSISDHKDWKDQKFRASQLDDRIVYSDAAQNKSSIDQITIKGSDISIGGWVVIDGMKCDTQHIYIEFVDENGKATQWTAENAYRFDIGNWLGADYYYSGYYTNIPEESIKDGIYTVKIIAENEGTVLPSAPRTVKKENGSIAIIK